MMRIVNIDEEAGRPEHTAFNNVLKAERALCIRQVDAEQSQIDDKAVQEDVNIIFWRCLKMLEFQLPEYYAIRAKETLPHLLNLVSHYNMKINLHESKILMSWEKHTYTNNTNVLNIFTQCLKQDAVNYKRKFRRFMNGCYVFTHYNNRIYRIDDVDWDQTATFVYNRRSVSYKDYFKMKYNMNISRNPQPMLVSRAKPTELRIAMPEIVYLVPELCRLAEETDILSVKRTSMHVPDKRIRREQGVPAMPSDLNKWEAHRTLQIYNINLLTPELDNSWAVLCPIYLKHHVLPFLQNLRRYSSRLGLSLPNPHVYDIVNDGPIQYLEAIDNVMNKYSPRLILCVLKKPNKIKYEAIKKKCCIERPVLSQVIRVRNKMDTIIPQLTQQINKKLGRVQCLVELPKNLMVIGLDVCPDNVNRSKSYSAMVASLDNLNTRYFNIVSAHTTDEELGNNIRNFLIQSVKQYSEENGGRMPDRIIIYRNDGIRDDQLTHVLKYEVEIIRSTLQNIRKKIPIKFAFIVVRKRMKTKTFVELTSHLADSVRYWFYNVRQESRYSALVHSTLYLVVYDTLRLHKHTVQRITYSNGLVSTAPMPRVCQYACKLAYLVSHLLHRDPHPDLKKSLFFL